MSTSVKYESFFGMALDTLGFCSVLLGCISGLLIGSHCIMNNLAQGKFYKIYLQ